MKVVYIAGPYRGPNAWAIEQNIRRAEDAAVLVWKAGMAALCPHANARHMLEGNVTDEHALAGTLEMMQRCDAVLLVDDWKRSDGSRKEVREAMRLGLPVLRSWGAHVDDNLRDLAAMDSGFRSVTPFDPFAETYWMGRYTA